MAKRHQFDHKRFRIEPGKTVKLDDLPTEAYGDFSKADARKELSRDIAALAEAQQLLWANGSRAVLIILQAMDAAGKDGTIRHVMSGVNPQGCSVHSFKAPNSEEVLHHFLWRPRLYLPAKGRIAIFNRSYYEEVLVVRVHPEFLEPQRLPAEPRGHDLWKSRFRDIMAFEDHLTRNGTSVIKFFLHVSKGEQKERFLDRLDEPEKNWKFSEADLRERGYWKDYRHAYEEMLEHTSTDAAPWYVIPADNKWYTRAVVADIITTRIEALDLQPPTVSDERRAELAEARKRLVAEEE
ncbi:MAG TPA: polyphosphate kinase 2 family protein [Phycisphaerae bacterium]|nr:polyphosphate kinase 2 family protein [Phycisphaerae bacterium]HRW51267.1 polyphosphate kinase 2 family protein [Phycisphaerae bacterium]